MDIRISSSQNVVTMSPDNPPAASCPLGSTITFETRDCYDEKIQGEQDLFHTADPGRINPASGPVYIEGTRPGDILQVEILRIELADHGCMALAPGDGPLGEDIREEVTRIIPVREGRALIREGLEIPLRPMIGVIGTAPASQAVPTGTPGEHGSNLDCRKIQEGSTLFLPVQVPGALLAVGDLHGVMGDGETAGCGLEISGRVTVKVSRWEGLRLPVPSLKTADEYITLASGENLDQAVWLAGRKMASFLIEAGKLEPWEAIMLLSLEGNMEICQVVNPLKTARMAIPASLLKKLSFDLFQ